MLTIKQLADLVGVTPRAVRHYHRIGLLPEPPRTAQGYRSYGSADIIALQRIKVLTDAGVPLARVAELAATSLDDLAVKAQEIEAKIDQRIHELETTKLRLRALAAGRNPFLSPKAAMLHEALDELNVSEETRKISDEGWILTSVLFPEFAEAWGRWQLRALEDPEYRELFILTDQARHDPPASARLEELAQRCAAWVRHHDQLDDSGLDPTAMDLIRSFQESYQEPWRWLNRRIEELLLQDPPPNHP